MTIYSPKFDVNNFELRGEVDKYLTQDQFGAALDAEYRVPSQMDWLGQLLGWSGTNYWTALSATVDQKRQLLSGSFGVYNGYIYPEIVEIRNWDNTVVVKNNPYIKAGQVFTLADSEYVLQGATLKGENLELNFGVLPEQFYTDIATTSQLKVTAVDAIPAPFRRPLAGASADRSFTCGIEGESITLYPQYDTGKTLPYVFNTFYTGSRYYFDLPVVLFISEGYYLTPQYNFTNELWFIDIPCQLEQINAGLSARLEYGDSFLVVSIKQWEDPSDWLNSDTIRYFLGDWGNKGGFLPYHHVFDSLSLHGFDEKKSILLEPVEREIGFDDLLNFVYQQKVDVDQTPPPIDKPFQTWWDSVNNKFSVYLDDPVNCGPWIQSYYPEGLDEEVIPDLTFSNVASFRSYTEDFPEGVIVLILDASNLGSIDNILGVTQTLTSPASATLYKPKNMVGWIALDFTYDDENSFNADALSLPTEVKIIIQDSSGLSGVGANYQVNNLKFTISDPYPTNLMRYSVNGAWYLSPPNTLKYIGNTRLYESSLDFEFPVNGEMQWDFSEPDVSIRTASIFLYTGWEYNSLLSEWEMVGDWFDVNTGEISPSEPPQVVNYGAVLVYCGGNLVTEGETFLSETFQFSYTTDNATGKFTFNYTPNGYEGSVVFPKITISDSLTASYTFDISDMVFSGLKYYASPNVADSETLLRVWKSATLYCIDNVKDQTISSFPNALVADLNTGPSDPNWERYFIRLPPSFQRNGGDWQKVNLICQNFGYWGSSILPEDMSCPSMEEKPNIYEEIITQKVKHRPSNYVYSEPYFYSAYVPEFGYPEDYDNAMVIPVPDVIVDSFIEGKIMKYDPLHERRVDTDSRIGKGYGEWAGDYYRVSDCSFLNGHLVNDINLENVEGITPPIWDSSIYKLPNTCIINKESSKVDANHFKVNYAFFIADLSAAEEAVFDFN